MGTKHRELAKAKLVKILASPNKTLNMPAAQGPLRHCISTLAEASSLRALITELV